MEDKLDMESRLENKSPTYRSFNSSQTFRRYEVEVESPENVELEGKIQSVVLYKETALKTFLYYFLMLISGGITFLLCHWMPKLKIQLSLTRSSVAEATKIIVFGADKTIEILPIKQQKSKTEETKVFEYRLFKYCYNFDKNKFTAAQFAIGKISFNQMHQQYGRGLNTSEYENNLVFFGPNLTDIPIKQWYHLLVEEVLSPFYIFQVYSVIVWCFDDYALYSAIIVFFSAISITITLVESLRTRKKLREMSYYETEVFVHRRHATTNVLEKSRISSSMLVPGDLFEIPEHQKMPCDAILLTGTTIMNEAMLTGESIPVIKNPLPTTDNIFDPAEDKQYTLYAGTMCIRARNNTEEPVFGIATHTGFTTVKGELIRTMMFPKPSNFKFYEDSFRFIGILAFMAVIEFCIDLKAFMDPSVSNAAVKIIIKSSEIVTVTVPPALPTCMSIGISVALQRLQKKRIFCIADQKINEAGRVNVMCFDKTGTLTEDGLDMLGVRPVAFDPTKQKLTFDKMIKDIPSLAGSSYEQTTIQRQLMLEILASCHSITKIEDVGGAEKLIGDPLDIKMYEAAKWDLIEGLNIPAHLRSTVLALVKPSGQSEGIGIYRRFDFASKLQRMSVIAKSPSENSYKLYTKGSPEKIRELCLEQSIPTNFHRILMKYTENGYRVLGVATKMLSLEDRQINEINREDVETELTFVGFLVMENKLKPVTKQIIDVLQKAAVRTIMVTGDNVLTAISVARQCNIVKQTQRIFLGDLSENKINDKYYIVWKDFEFSDSTLDDENLEPELDVIHPPMGGPDDSFTNMVKSPTSPNTAEKRDFMTVDVKSGNNLSFLSGGDSSPDKPPSLRSMADEDVDGAYLAMESPFAHMDVNSNYVIAITGKAFSLILKEIESGKDEKFKNMLEILLKKAVVFARMHPDEKAMMITQMQTIRKNIVGMCGDGANDCGALKAANVGISLSEAEASIAAPFTSQIQDISCVVYLLRNGRAALTTSFQCFKYMALYSVIQSTTVTIVYYHLVDLVNAAYYYIDIFIILPLSFTMGMTGVFKKLTIYQPTGRLISVPILLSVVGQAFIQITGQVVVMMMVRNGGYADRATMCPIPGTYDGENEGEAFGNDYPCNIDGAMFMISIFQYTMVALAFMVGAPFRKPIWTNRWFSGFFLVLMFINTVLCLNPWGSEWLQTSDFFAISNSVMYQNLGNKIFIVAVINCIATMIWERIAVKYLSLAWKKHRDQNFRQNLKNRELAT